MSNKTRIAIVDDHQIVIDGLKSLIEGHEQFEISAVFTRPQELLDWMEGNRIDILLTDILMPEMDGRTLSALIRKRFPLVKILALSMSGDGVLVNQMIAESAISGYVLKNIGKQELLEALLRIAAGQTYFTGQVRVAMERAAGSTGEPRLTDRELEIIRLIEKEFSNKSIADTLYISERTVETHRKNIFRKTKTNSVVGLVKYAYEHRLI